MCQRQKGDDKVDCEQCHIENEFEYEVCCLEICGEQSFCKYCHKYKTK